MSLRVAKVLLVAAVAFFYTLVVFNNSTDYASNYQFVHHVLLMDTTFPGNHGMWRAIHPDVVYTVFYDGIISWEALTTVLAWIGVIQLARALRKPAAAFNRAKRFSVIALTLALLLWFVAFISVGGEWFLMWQSKIWNGQEAAFRMFACIGIIFVLLAMPESEGQP
jgi:predicted small integral membrane protein